MYAVDTKCEQCGVWLCCRFDENYHPNCFRNFHTKPNLLNNESSGAIHESDEEGEADDEEKLSRRLILVQSFVPQEQEYNSLLLSLLKLF